MRAVGYFFLNTVQAIWLITSSVVWISLALVASIFSRDLPLIMARWLWGPGLVWGGGARMVVHPGPTLDPRGPYVFVMNHQSMLDIPVAFAYLPVNLRFIAKRVLKYIP